MLKGMSKGCSKKLAGRFAVLTPECLRSKAGRNRKKGIAMKRPADCMTMQDIRAEIDRLDVALIGLLVERVGYIDRAAQVKTEIGLPARITDRVEQVVANVCAEADAQGLAPDLAETLWRQLIDWSIAREETVLGADARTEAK